MSSVTITIGNIRAIAEAVAAKRHYNDDFSIQIIDAGSEIVVRDINDMFITNWKKPPAEKNANSFSHHKNRFR